MSGPFAESEVDSLKGSLRSKGYYVSACGHGGILFAAPGLGAYASVTFSPTEIDRFNAEFIVWAMEQIEKLEPESMLQRYQIGGVWYADVVPGPDVVSGAGPNLATAIARALVEILESSDAPEKVGENHA